LDHFIGRHFLRWQKRVQFLLTSLHLVYVINTPRSNEFEDETIDWLKRRQRWETDDYTCRRNILNKWMTHYLTYTTMWILSGVIGKIGDEVHEEDRPVRNFLSQISIFFKMVDERHVMEQFCELERILNHYIIDWDNVVSEN